MCQQTNTIKFCTCADKETLDNSEYTWVLRRLVAIKEDSIVGKVMMPVDDLKKGIDAKSILPILSSNNCFDFEYQENEEDTFMIYRNSKEGRSFMSLVFRDGKWQSGTNPAFISEKKILGEGFVEF